MKNKMRPQKKISTDTVSCLLTLVMLLGPQLAMAGGGTESGSAEGWEMVYWFRDIMQGWLGALIALIAFFAGIVTWVVAKNPWGVLFAWFIGVLLVKGPAMMLSLFTAAL